MPTIWTRFYLLGRRGLLLPRLVRRLIARNEWHRAWLVGHMGIYFDESGHRYGVCDREWSRYRKGPQCGVPPSFIQLLTELASPFGRPIGNKI
jgi:hypothetical protein